MKKICLAVLAILMATQAFSDEPKPSPTPPTKGPRITVEPESFDFGKSLQNRTLHKEFSVRNFGNEDLIIENVSTTCGCTAALPDTKILKPGAHTPLRVSLETRAYSGRVERKIVIKTNDPVKSLYAVKVLTTVEEEKKTN